MGVAKAVGDFLKIERCLPLDDGRMWLKLSADLVNEFTEKSLKILKESGINKKRKSQGIKITIKLYFTYEMQETNIQMLTNNK